MKSLQLTLDDGTNENRTILSGIHAFYEPEELVGKTCIAITNLPPRPMMGIESCGMLISAIHKEEGEEKLCRLIAAPAHLCGREIVRNPKKSLSTKKREFRSEKTGGISMKWFEDIFTKTKLMIVSGTLGVAGYAFLAVSCIINPAPLIANYLILAGLLAALLICYKKGETSCQKALAGAILGILMYAYWTIVGGTFGKGSGGVVFLETFMTIFLTVVFMNHIILQVDHKGDSKVIIVSQIMLVIAIIWQFAETVAQIFGGGQYYDIINSFSLLSAVTMITCMESRIQKYKAIRAAALSDGTWTEEKRQKYKKIFKF